MSLLTPQRVAAAQALYYVPTGVWGVVGLKSFQKVTGPKTDKWLVQTVGLLVTAIGAALAVSAKRGRVPPETPVLAVASALGLAGIGAYHAGRGRISKIYLADAVVELAFALAWLLAWRRVAARGPASDAA